MNAGVGISGDGLSTSVNGDGEVASDGIISYYPEFSQFGDFRNGVQNLTEQSNYAQ